MTTQPLFSRRTSFLEQKHIFLGSGLQLPKRETFTARLSLQPRVRIGRELQEGSSWQWGPDPRWRFHLLGEEDGRICIPAGSLMAEFHPRRVKQVTERSLCPVPITRRGPDNAKRPPLNRPTKLQAPLGRLGRSSIKHLDPVPFPSTSPIVSSPPLVISHRFLSSQSRSL